MISQDVDLYQTKLDWTGLFHAAVWQGKIYLVEDKFDLSNQFNAKSTLVHELTHILQAEYSMPERPSTFDGDKARTSLTEGDATLMADTFKNNGVVPPPAEVNIPTTSSLPSSINKLNRFVYRYGVEFIKALYEEGGWGRVESAYENPPKTTEQIMHPEKYFAQEDAQTVEAPTINGDWNLTKSEKYGEYFIRVMLEEWISEDDAEQAAEGWGGDTLAYYERDAEYLFTWKIVWDSADDAHEFYIAFQEMMYETSAEKENCSYWIANGRYISIQWNEGSTLIISSDNESIVQQPLLE